MTTILLRETLRPTRSVPRNLELIQPIEDLPSAPVDRLTIFREAQLARGPVEDRDPQMPFQIGYRVADRRWGYPEAASCLGEASGIRSPHHHFEPAQLFHTGDYL
jgi:hypothetical protein